MSMIAFHSPKTVDGRLYIYSLGIAVCTAGMAWAGGSMSWRTAMQILIVAIFNQTLNFLMKAQKNLEQQPEIIKEDEK